MFIDNLFLIANTIICFEIFSQLSKNVNHLLADRFTTEERNALKPLKLFADS